MSAKNQSPDSSHYLGVPTAQIYPHDVRRVSRRATRASRAALQAVLEQIDFDNIPAPLAEGEKLDATTMPEYSVWLIDEVRAFSSKTALASSTSTAAAESSQSSVALVAATTRKYNERTSGPFAQYYETSFIKPETIFARVINLMVVGAIKDGQVIGLDYAGPERHKLTGHTRPMLRPTFFELPATIGEINTLHTVFGDPGCRQVREVHRLTP